MANSFLKVAHDWGVQQALQQAGYRSVEEVHKEAQALGLTDAPKVAHDASVDLNALFRSLPK
jgi:hypothetical protein